MFFHIDGYLEKVQHIIVGGIGMEEEYDDKSKYYNSCI